ncbi:MAG: AAA family ATPase [Pseudomonadota bacterium]
MPYYLITGCSSGGKSTLLAALDARGYHTIPEPGRRIVAEERAGDGKALPWVDALAFSHRALQMAREDLAGCASQQGPVFFDRGLIDAAVALQHAAEIPLSASLGSKSPYQNPVFLAPPWSEIYQKEADRPHGFDAAVAEYYRIKEALTELNLKVVHLPKISLEERVEFVLSHLP